MGGAVAVAAFGPYLAGSIRTEQAAVYLTFGACAALCLWRTVRLSPAGVLVLACLGVEWLVAMMGSVQPVVDLTEWPRGSVLAGVDNLTAPVAVLLTVWMLLAAGAERRALLRAVCRVLVAAMCLNSVLAYASQRTDLTWLFAHFWTGSGATGHGTVAGRSAELGRFTGIINQPFEAGALASLALLAAIYLFRDRPWRLAVVGGLVAVGGVLSVSKVFLLVGLPAALWQLLRLREHRHGRLLTLGGIAALAWLVGRFGGLPSWSGAPYLLRLFHLDSGGGGAVDQYTAGRLGATSTLRDQVVAVIHFEPWFGFGFGSLAVPPDNGWVEALTYAGLVGAAAYTAVLATLVGTWWRRRTAMSQPERALSGGVVFVTMCGSLGAPMLTVNRASTILWLLLGLTLLAGSECGDHLNESGATVAAGAGRVAVRGRTATAPAGAVRAAGPTVAAGAGGRGSPAPAGGARHGGVGR